MTVLRCSASLKCVLWSEWSYICSFLKKKEKKKEATPECQIVPLSGSKVRRVSFLPCFLRGDVRHAAHSNCLWQSFEREEFQERLACQQIHEAHKRVCLSLVPSLVFLPMAWLPHASVCETSVWRPFGIWSILGWSSDLDGDHRPAEPAMQCGVRAVPGVQDMKLLFFLLCTEPLCRHFILMQTLMANKVCLNVAKYVMIQYGGLMCLYCPPPPIMTAVILTRVHRSSF